MGDVTSLVLIRGLWDYHWWANRLHFGLAADLGTEVDRDLGTHWSFPTLKGMLAHIYGADWVWLRRWRGGAPAALPSGTDFASMEVLRERWDTLENEQRAFLGRLGGPDLARVVEYRNTRGDHLRSPMWHMLQHVPNHATHHRSEVAAMLTLVKGSPPNTDLIHYYRTIAAPATS
jgi:uncharacterized damage-inducible protein DinB